MTHREPTASFHGDGPVAISTASLPDRRDLALTAMERTRMPMAITDPRQPDNPIVLANRAFLELTGYEPDEVIGRNPRFMQGPDTDHATIAVLRDALALEREAVVELVNYRKDGSAFLTQLFVSPVHDDNGKLIYFFGSMLDITERRESQRSRDAEHRLMKEVDHRAKNALAVVQAIVRLSRADDPHAYSDAVQRRVEVLARAHTLLAEAGWSALPLELLLREALIPYCGATVSLRGPDVTIAPAKVQSLALLFHELAANARRFGALTPGGEVRVEWDLPEPQRLRLHWREQGQANVPDRDATPGFGFTIIRAIGTRQLGGQVAIDLHQHGLEASLTLPLEHAVRQEERSATPGNVVVAEA